MQTHPVPEPTVRPSPVRAGRSVPGLACTLWAPQRLALASGLPEAGKLTPQCHSASMPRNKRNPRGAEHPRLGKG